MNLFDNASVRLFALVLITSLPIVIVSIVLSKFSDKKIYRYLSSIFVMLLGIGVFIYSRTIRESMMDLAYSLIGMVLIMSSALSVILIFAFDVISSRKTKK